MDRKELSVDTVSASELILDFSDNRIARNKCLLFTNHPIYSISFSSPKRIKEGPKFNV